MYPGEGTRWTYFGTSGTTHALGEPAYIVRALPRDAQPLANGLPVFDVNYENDDDPRRIAGKNSRLLFTAPADGLYTVRVGDTRGEGGSEYGYQLSIRAADPGFKPSTQAVNRPLHPAVGREFRIRVDRIDGYEGDGATLKSTGLPDRLMSNFPVTDRSGAAICDRDGLGRSERERLGRRDRADIDGVGDDQRKASGKTDRFDRQNQIRFLRSRRSFRSSNRLMPKSARMRDWTLKVRRGRNRFGAGDHSTQGGVQQ